MNTAQSFQAIAKPIAHQFRHVAPTSLDWASEREFLYAQIFRPGNEAVIEMVERGVEETIESIRRAARSSAAMGLTMNPTAALVYFIPRRARKRNSELYPEDAKESEYKRNVPWILTATPSYRGLAFICTHYAGFDDVVSEVVYKGDPLKEYHGPLEPFRHQPTLEPTQRVEKEALGAYAMFVKGNRVRTEYVDAPTIQLVRGQSDHGNGLMWTRYWTEGWRKVPVRRGAKLAMQGAGIVPTGGERWAAAETAMQADDGVTFDHDTGAPVNVPRGTSAEPTSGAQTNGSKPRGMGGLKDRMSAAATRAQDAQTETELPPAGKTLLALPAPSKNPEGSIEWWLDQVRAGDTVARLDEIRAAALTAGLDRSEDADSFRRVFADQKRALRGPAGTTGKLV